MKRHLLSAGDLTRDEAELVLSTAEEMRSLADRPIKKLPALRGRTIVNLFFEDSTRTRISFEAAGKRLSADVINFAAKGSSLSKGESLKDTALTLEAMGADAVVVRHGASGAPHRLASSNWIRSSVVNAGDGTHEHPTQALLDAFTMWRHLGPLDGRRVAIVGDVLHSRVARSNALLLHTLGAQVTLVAPPTLLPVGVETWPVETSYDLDAVIPKADVVMMLRVQQERMHAAFFPTAREYSRRYGLDGRRMATLQDHTIVMHPGPMVRGMEITADVADSARSVIVEQVTNGVAVRMAVLYLLLGGSRAAPPTCRPSPRPRSRRVTERMTPYLIQNARILGGEPTDLLLRDGVIAEIGTGVQGGDAEVVDADGLVALPGLVDLHTHLREPGREDAETVESGTRAAALGGFTAVHAMANTEPVADTAGVVEQVWRLGREAGHCDVYPVGAVTVGLAGERLAELGAMADSAARVRVFSDDGKCVSDALLMRRALEYVKAFDGVIAQHAQEPRLTEGAQMNEGELSGKLGLAGWPAVAEEAIIARDVPAGGPRRVAAARLPRLDRRLGRDRPAGQGQRVGRHRRGVPAPPAADRRAGGDLRPDLQGQPAAARRAATPRRCGRGWPTAPSTSSRPTTRPHPLEDKDCEWAAAAFGMLGLETALSIVQETMVDTGLLDWAGVADRMSYAPARIGRVADHGQPLEVGAPANVVLYDPSVRRVVDARRRRRCRATRRTPGMELPGRVVATFLRGRPTVLDGKLV